MKRLLVSLVAVAIASASCTDVTGVSDGVINAERTPGQVVLRNLSSSQVFYFVVDQQLLPLVDWAPCVNPACPSLPPHGTITVYDRPEQANLRTPTAFVVYWWRAVPDGRGGSVPDSLRQLVVHAR